MVWSSIVHIRARILSIGYLAQSESELSLLLLLCPPRL